MRIATLHLILTLAPLAWLMSFASAGAQEPVERVPAFDPDRAILNDEPWFEPFRPSEYKSLASALADGDVEKETPLLVLARDGRQLGLITRQMTYHHVAQGELAGEPWMVSF